MDAVVAHVKSCTMDKGSCLMNVQQLLRLFEKLVCRSTDICTLQKCLRHLRLGYSQRCLKMEGQRDDAKNHFGVTHRVGELRVR